MLILLHKTLNTCSPVLQHVTIIFPHNTLTVLLTEDNKAVIIYKVRYHTLSMHYQFYHYTELFYVTARNRPEDILNLKQFCIPFTRDLSQSCRKKLIPKLWPSFSYLWV